MNLKFIAISGLFCINVAVALPKVVDATAAHATATSETRLTDSQRIAILERQINNFNQMQYPQKIESLQSELQAMHGEVESLQHEIDQLHQAQEALTEKQKQMSVMQAQEQVVSAEKKEEQTVLSNKSNQPVSQELKTYQAAFSLISDKDYDDAIQAMNAYVKIYPHGQYTPNAYYWLGELYTIKNKNKEAIAALQTVVHHFPKSNKTPDAMLRLGMVYQATGDKKKAKAVYTELQKHYPHSFAAKIASKKVI
ncbi:MAG: tol-pal system protein YbgF [Gammaproteobacteria bacterium]